MEISAERESEVVTVVDVDEEDGREALGFLFTQGFTLIQEEGSKLVLWKPLAASTKDNIIHFLNNNDDDDDDEEEEETESVVGAAETAGAQSIDREKNRLFSIRPKTPPKFGAWSSSDEASVQNSEDIKPNNLLRSPICIGLLSDRHVVIKQFSEMLSGVGVDIPQKSFATLIFEIYLTESGETRDVEVAILLKQMRFGTKGCLNDKNARGYFVYGVQVECQPCHSWAPIASCTNAAPTNTPLVFTVNNTRSFTTTIAPIDPRTCGFALQGQRQLSYNIPCHKICPAKVVEDDCTIIWSWEMLSWKAKNGFTAFEHDKPCFGLYRGVLSTANIPSLGVESPLFVNLDNAGEGVWRLDGMGMEKTSGSLELAWNVRVTMRIGIVRREKMKIKGFPTPLKSLNSDKRELKFESQIEFCHEKVEKQVSITIDERLQQRRSHCWLC